MMSSDGGKIATVYGESQSGIRAKPTLHSPDKNSTRVCKKKFNLHSIEHTIRYMHAIIGSPMRRT